MVIIGGLRTSTTKGDWDRARQPSSELAGAGRGRVLGAGSASSGTRCLRRRFRPFAPPLVSAVDHAVVVVDDYLTGHHAGKYGRLTKY